MKKDTEKRLLFSAKHTDIKKYTFLNLKGVHKTVDPTYGYHHRSDLFINASSKIKNDLFIIVQFQHSVKRYAFFGNKSFYL